MRLEDIVYPQLVVPNATCCGFSTSALLRITITVVIVFHFQTVDIASLQYNISAESDDLCLCVESFTYGHPATSPVFDYKELSYDSEEYSTWTESG